jgi:AraC family transcriptional regulator
MRDLADPDAVFLSMPDVPRHASGTQALSKLISAAAATLDSDRATARACLQRAAELLSVTIEGRLSPADTASGGGLAPWQQRNVTEYLAANIASTIRVCDLAWVAGLSPGHFFRAFRESFGETPLSHVVNQRVQHAQSLMLSTAAPYHRSPWIAGCAIRRTLRARFAGWSA